MVGRNVQSSSLLEKKKKTTQNKAKAKTKNRGKKQTFIANFGNLETYRAARTRPKTQKNNRKSKETSLFQVKQLLWSSASRPNRSILMCTRVI